MERISSLIDFFAAIEKDGHISITHIGVYAALLKYRTDRGFINPVEAYSYEIMHIAKISAANTYHKCVKDLSRYGYIEYLPSFKRNRASKIYFKE